MSREPLSILLICDAPGGAERILSFLEQSDVGQFHLQCTAANAVAISRFKANYYDICLVDCLDDGPSFIAVLHGLAFNAPVVVITGDSANEVLSAIHQGATDCLVRTQLTPAALEQTIFSAISRAQNKEARAKNERCYRGIMENAREVIYTHDLDGNLTSINKAGEQITGYGAKEIAEMNVRQLIAPEFLLAAWRAISGMLASRKRGFFETLILTKEGKRVKLEVTIHLIYREGTPVGVQGIARETWSTLSSSVATAERSRSA